MLYHSFWAGRVTRPPVIAIAHKYLANAMPLTAREKIQKCHLSGQNKVTQDGASAHKVDINCAHTEGMLSFLGGYFGTKAERVEKPRPPEVDSRTVYVRGTDVPLKKEVVLLLVPERHPRLRLMGVNIDGA